VELRPGYKQTEVGIIPEDWETAALSELVTDGPKNGYSGKSGKDARGTLTLSLGATTSGQLVLNPETTKRLYESIDQQSDLHLVPGDVLVQRSNTLDLVGTTAVFDGPPNTYVYPDLMMRLRFRDQATAHWFWRYANGSNGRRFFMSSAAGSSGSMPKISGETLRNMLLPLPPLPEQRAIAEALSDVDALLDALDRLIEKKRDLKQAAMQELLTGRTRLPGFNGKWETKRLGDHVRFMRNGVNSRAELVADGSVKYLHYGDIHTSEKSRLDVSAEVMPYLPPDRASGLDRLEDGDVVFADASEDLTGVGKSVEVTGTAGVEAVAGLHTIAARFNKSVLADGFKALLQFCAPFQEQLLRLAAGTKVFATTRTHIASIELPLPKLEEQIAIAAVLSDMDAELAVLEARREKTRALKQGMMQELLTGRTRLV
jgi:type I restriction enzyme S subunit